mmetsp:Transcript_10200/g.26751  ORF Transcript_10200/g.26751 Transcript_10200/m.26751 type:complete len:202 (-) Transcript_10200:66-671(-)
MVRDAAHEDHHARTEAGAAVAHELVDREEEGRELLKRANGEQEGRFRVLVKDTHDDDVESVVLVRDTGLLVVEERRQHHIDDAVGQEEERDAARNRRVDMVELDVVRGVQNVTVRHPKAHEVPCTDDGHDEGRQEGHDPGLAALALRLAHKQGQQQVGAHVESDEDHGRRDEDVLVLVHRLGLQLLRGGLREGHPVLLDQS